MKFLKINKSGKYLINFILIAGLSHTQGISNFRKSQGNSVNFQVKESLRETWDSQGSFKI